MLRCEDVAAGVTDYLERQDGLVRRMRFHCHVLLCRACARHVEKTRLMLLALRDVPGDDDVPPELLEAFRTTLSR